MQNKQSRREAPRNREAVSATGLAVHGTLLDSAVCLRSYAWSPWCVWGGKVVAVGDGGSARRQRYGICSGGGARGANVGHHGLGADAYGIATTGQLEWVCACQWASGLRWLAGCGCRRQYRGDGGGAISSGFLSSVKAYLCIRKSAMTFNRLSITSNIALALEYRRRFDRTAQESQVTRISQSFLPQGLISYPAKIGNHTT